MYLFSSTGTHFEPGQVQNLSTCWKEVLEMGIEHTFPKDYIFTFHKNFSNKFALITSGRLYSAIIDKNGDQRITLFVGQNCLLNESYALAGCYDNILYHKCITDVKMVLFDGSLVHNKEFIQKYPFLIQNCAYSVARKFVVIEAIYTAVRKKTSRKKLAWYITRQSLYQNGALKFASGLTQTEVAWLLGIHKSSMTRAITALKDDGLIKKFSKNCIEILDFDGLVKLSEE